jgi:hypothetical protein
MAMFRTVANHGLLARKERAADIASGPGPMVPEVPTTPTETCTVGRHFAKLTGSPDEACTNVLILSGLRTQTASCLPVRCARFFLSNHRGDVGRRRTRLHRLLAAP